MTDIRLESRCRGKSLWESMVIDWALEQGLVVAIATATEDGINYRTVYPVKRPKHV